MNNECKDCTYAYSDDGCRPANRQCPEPKKPIKKEEKKENTNGNRTENH